MIFQIIVRKTPTYEILYSTETNNSYLSIKAVSVSYIDPTG